MTTSQKLKYSSHVVVAKVLSIEKSKKPVKAQVPSGPKLKEFKAVVLCQSIYKGAVTTKTLTIYYYSNARYETISLKKDQEYLFFISTNKKTKERRIVNSIYGAISVVKEKQSKAHKDYLKALKEVKALTKK
ncbi:MAG: hypothetical protein P1V97_39715 [Planctomycetota bacterium]|nr:hypothetical protein [Planctomycetota bacterium]